MQNFFSHDNHIHLSEKTQKFMRQTIKNLLNSGFYPQVLSTRIIIKEIVLIWQKLLKKATGND